MSHVVLFAALLLPMGGDAIGPTPSETDNTGGFSGAPAVLVRTPVPRTVERLDAVLFGEFDPWRLEPAVYTLAAYLANQPPEELPPLESWRVEAWGNAGVAAGNRATKLVSLEVGIDLKAGEYVIGLRSPQRFLMAGSRSADGPMPYYERPGVVPRGKLPSNSIRWAMNVMAAPEPGDFNLDGAVDALDYDLWQHGFGSQYDGLDLLAWQYGGGARVGVDPIPEPLAWITAWIGICFALSWGDRNGALRR